MNKQSIQKRGSIALAGAVMALALLTACVSTDQNTAFKLVNTDRAANGKRALVLDNELSTKAQAWSAHLAATGTLAHSTLTSGVTSCYKALGENVGKGSSIANVEKSWMTDAGVNPPIHRNNILGSSTHVGTGVTLKGGVYWVVYVFRTAC